jgi:hypothetical protein
MRSGVKIAVITAGVAGAALGVAYGWFGSQRPPPPAVAAPQTSANPGYIDAIAPPAPATPPPVEISIDSIAAALSYPIADWQIATAEAGWFDAFESQSVAVPPGSSVRVAPATVVVARGWAGDQALGTRLPFVLLTACETVVASVRVDLPRPDVARAVHPNLEQSGWQANLFVDDLPQCDPMILRAYAVGPAGRIVFPLAGEFALKPSPAQTTAPFTLRRAAAPLQPADIPETPQIAGLSIRTARANLRRCGDPSCPVVGSLATGEHQAAVLDEAREWLLISAGGTAGWIARRFVEPAPPAPTSVSQRPARR